MDARITKTRLSNLLSYDWIKILVAIAAAVIAICVFFTTVKTRPRGNQVFAVYAYREISGGEDSEFLADRLMKESVFSYDVLDTQFEAFGTGQYSDAAFSARRSAVQGQVMFVSSNLTSEEEGAPTVLENFTGGDRADYSLDLDRYFLDCENYLIRFFGADWEHGTLIEAEAERCFLARNGKDKRYRSAGKREQGIADEKARLTKLRDDYLFVRACLADGVLSLANVKDEEGRETPRAFALGALKDLRDLVFYTEVKDGKNIPSAENICMILFVNDNDAGKPALQVENDLRYEPLSFLRYLVEKYGG